MVSPYHSPGDKLQAIPKCEEEPYHILRKFTNVKAGYLNFKLVKLVYSPRNLSQRILQYYSISNNVVKIHCVYTSH